MGLIWSLPRWTCFSVAVDSRMRDISCQTGKVGPAYKSLILVLSVCHQSRGGWSDIALFQVEMVTYKVENLLGFQFQFFLNLLANLGPDTELLVFVCAGDRFGGIWPGPTSHLGTGGFLYPSVESSI